MTPRPLPDTDGHPPDLSVLYALVAAACTTAAYLTARTLLRRLP